MVSPSVLKSALPRQSGLSLIEVLMAIVILAVGLLGLAHMQSFGLLNVESAYRRSQATVLAYSIADKMRAHVGQPEDSAANLSRYLSSFMAPAAAEAVPDCKSTTGCSANEMTENDLFEWNQQLTDQIPGAAGTIRLVDGNYIVAIAWDDLGSDGDDDDELVTFETSFQP